MSSVGELYQAARRLNVELADSYLEIHLDRTDDDARIAELVPQG